ncbi:MAG: RCC1 domain-containing protein [Sporichthyaceae bacterium]
MTLKRSTTTVTPLQSVTFTGTSTPAAPGRPVTVQEKVGTSWRTVASTKLTSSSSFSVPLQLDAPTRTLTYRASLAATKTLAAATSATTTVAVSSPGPTVRQVSIGTTSACAVTTARAAICWGGNEHGQLGDGTALAQGRRDAPVPVYGLGSGVETVAVGAYFACALTTAKAVLCWGSNGVGQLGVGRESRDMPRADIPVPVQGLGSGVVAIAAGGSRACVLTDAGAVKCWGEFPGDGRGIENYELPRATAPVQVVGLESGAKAVANGCAIASDGLARCWGAGPRGDGQDGYAFAPVTPNAPDGHRYRSIVVGDGNVCAITIADAADCWGSSSGNQIGDASAGFGEIREPKTIPQLASGVSALSLGNGHTCALVKGALNCWGGNGYGQLGTGKRTQLLAPAVVPGLATGVVATAAGNGASCAISRAAALLCWGDSEFKFVGSAAGSTALKPAPVRAVRPVVPAPSSRSDLASISTGRDHSCGVTRAGAALCWGANAEAQLGDGTLTASSTPVPVRGLGSGVVEVSAGDRYSCAVLEDGSARCWGANQYGELGNGRPHGSLTPSRVANLTDVASVDASGAGGTACAVTRTGAAYCWGNDGNGQLGDGPDDRSTKVSALPVAVSGLDSGVRSVHVGFRNACALTIDGAVLCWGDNAFGQLGTGDAAVGTLSQVPVAVTGLTDGVAQLSLGDGHACAVRTGGTLECWGDNSSGQLTGRMERAAVPTSVGGLGEVRQADAGGAGTCALVVAGGVFCWGGGPLGDGLYGDQFVPQPVRSLGSGVAALSSGAEARSVLLTSGAAKRWAVDTRGIPAPV